MFIKTIAVGPLEPVLSCVTGGTTVAMHLDCGHSGLACRAAVVDRRPRAARFESAAPGVRKLMVQRLGIAVVKLENEGVT